jgi:hypothetical protein
MTQLKKLSAGDKRMLDDRWFAHVTKCARCALFDPARPSTLAQVCLEGAPVIKELLVYQAERQHASTRKKELRSFKKSMVPLHG